MVTLRVAVLVLFVVLVPKLVGQENTLSLGELARRERERRKAPTTGTQIVESPGVGVRLVIPAQWKAQDNPKQLWIDCTPEHLAGCAVAVESQALPEDEAAITDKDRKAWDSLENVPSGYRRLASRDLQVGGRPAYEVVFQDPSGMRERFIHVLARDGGRIYEFRYHAFFEHRDQFDRFAPFVDQVLQSLSPLGQPTSEEAETAKLVGKFSPEERIAIGNLGGLLSREQFCKAAVGKYLSLDEVVKGFSSSATLLPMEADPRRDANYEYHLVAHAESIELWANPRRPGLGGFFSDGTRICYNAQGPASSRDKKVFDLGHLFSSSAVGGETGSATSQPRPSASTGKKVWTDEDLQRTGGTVSTGTVPSATERPAGGPSRARGEAPRQGEYKPEEQRALGYECGFYTWLEPDCRTQFHRACTWEEMVNGVENGLGEIQGFTEDPRNDPDYEYRVRTSGEDYELLAIPRRPGLGGFLANRWGVRYNPVGQASMDDPKLRTCMGSIQVIRHEMKR